MAELNKTNKIRVATFNIGDYSTANGSSGDGIPLGNGTEVTKEEYVALIIDKLYNCNDVPLLDLVYQLLDKSVQEAA